MLQRKPRLYACRHQSGQLSDSLANCPCRLSNVSRHRLPLQCQVAESVIQLVVEEGLVEELEGVEASVETWAFYIKHIMQCIMIMPLSQNERSNCKRAVVHRNVSLTVVWAVANTFQIDNPCHTMIHRHRKIHIGNNNHQRLGMAEIRLGNHTRQLLHS